MAQGPRDEVIWKFIGLAGGGAPAKVTEVTVINGLLPLGTMRVSDMLNYTPTRPIM